MPIYQDEKTKTWFVKCYYTDYTGTKKQRKKRGFKLQREAKEWERDFLSRQQADLNMTFQDFVNLYFEDTEKRLKSSTIINKRNIVDSKLLPYFGKKPLAQITAVDVRNWQNDLITGKNKSNEPFSETYLKTINNQLTAIFNYAVRYYDLKENPCHKAGSIGKNNAKEMSFWTIEEFKTFLAVITKPNIKIAFLTLYYTGMRIGELLALTPSDINLDKSYISINKTLYRRDKKDIVTTPKTPKSKRVITIPEALRDKLQKYIEQLYHPEKNTRIFPFSRRYYWYELKQGIKKTDLKPIRLHDLRHSHASLLIELGFSPLAIADRLGHEKVETTLNTYSHLFPHKREEISETLQKLF